MALNGDEIDRGGTDFERINLRLLAADIPKCPVRATRPTEGIAPAVLPHSRAASEIDIRENIVIRRAPVMVETQVGPAARGRDISRPALHGNVVNEPLADLETGQQIIMTGESEAVMTEHPVAFLRSPELIAHTVDGAKAAPGEDSAVGIGDDQVTGPAVRDAGEIHRVETEL